MKKKKLERRMRDEAREADDRTTRVKIEPDG
jgi:hypothetical protein